MDATRASPLRAGGGTRVARSRWWLRRHWWVLGLGALIGLGGGAALLSVTSPVYASTSLVLVQAIGDASVDLPTEAQLARSTPVAADAATRVRAPVTLPTVKVLPGTHVLIIRYEAATSPAAQAGARAFAEAYLANRATAARATIDERQEVLRRRIAAYQAQLAGLDEQIARRSTPTHSAAGGLAPSTELTTLRNAADTLNRQIAELVARQDNLATMTVNPGLVVRQPERPTDPVRPVGWHYLTMGAGVGLALGTAAALARERPSRPVPRGAGIALVRRCGVPLLVELPDRVALAVVPPRDPAVRAFHRLRNEVVATLGDGRVILVTGASPGAASTVVAANLAVALSRAGNDVVLTCANAAAEGGTLAHLFDIADIPGLSDVLARRASLAMALQRAPGLPGLHVVTAGTAAGETRRAAVEVARTMAALRRQARFVVVEAPSTAAGAEAQSLAELTDAAIIVVETGHTSYDQVSDAALQLHSVGTRVLGVVAMARPRDGSPGSWGRSGSPGRSGAMGRSDSTGQPGSTAGSGPWDSTGLPVFDGDGSDALTAPTTPMALVRAPEAAVTDRAGLPRLTGPPVCPPAGNTMPVPGQSDDDHPR